EVVVDPGAEQTDEQSVLGDDQRHRRGDLRRGITAEHEVDFVDVDQLAVDAGDLRRARLIIVIDELHLAAEQTALGVDVVLPDFHGDKRHLAVRRERPGQRHAEADLDRLLRERRAGERQRGGDGAADHAPFEYSKHSVLPSLWRFLKLSLAALLAEAETSATHRPQISSASSTIMRSFAHCSSSASTLPSSVEAKPHCGDRHSRSNGTYLVASSIRRLISSFGSSRPLFEVTRPSTTSLSPVRCRSGSKPPARSVSNSRK